MNKDTLNGILKYNRGAEKEIARLREENIKLQEKIDKAIEYIESSQLYGMRSGKTLYSKVMQETINILRGEDNE